MKKTLIILIISIFALGANAHAIGISPPGIEAAAFNLTAPNTFLFEIKNLNNVPYTLNLTFEMTPSSNYLEPYVTFSPPGMQITPEDKKTNFTITLTGNIPSGNHLLVFIPRIEFIEEEPQMNDTGSINTAGIIISTSAAYIDFTIPEGPPPPPPPPPPPGPSGSGPPSGDAPSPLEEDSNVTEVPEKIINLTIEVPLVVKAVEPGVTVTIKLKNTGDITLKNLTIEFVSTPPLNQEYDKQIGTLYPNQQKAINVKLSDFTGTEHIIEATVSDLETGNKWAINFTVRVPKEPRGTIGQNCIEYIPKNFTVKADKKSQIRINIKNKCNISLHDINAIINSLGYREVIGKLDKNESRTITLDVLLPGGISNHRVIFVYSEGETTGQISINAAVSYLGIILNAIALILLFIVLLLILYLILYLYRKNRKEVHERQPQTGVRERIHKLRKDIKGIDDLISKSSGKKAAIESQIFEKKQELDNAERTEEQLKMCLENVRGSIEYKKKLLESFNNRGTLEKGDELRLLEEELKQLEESIKAKRALLNSLASRQKREVSTVYRTFKSILNNLKPYIRKIYLAHIRPQIEKPLEKEEYRLLKHHIVSNRGKSTESKNAVPDTMDKKQTPGHQREESILKNILNQLRSYIGNIHKDSKTDQLPENLHYDSAKYHIEPDLEKSTEPKITSPDTLTQKDLSDKEEKISENLLGQLKSSIEKEKDTLYSLKTEEDLLDNPVFKETILERNFNELQSVIGEEKELLKSLRTEEESLHLKSEAYKRSLIRYRKELSSLSDAKNVRILDEKKKSLQDVLLALERLHKHDIISKDVYDSHRFLELELNSVDKIIYKKLKEEDAIKKEAEGIPEKNKRKGSKKARRKNS